MNYGNDNKDGKKDGLQIGWHANGNKEAESTFKDGQLEGLQIAWDENGKIIGQAHFKNGVKVGD